MTVLGGGFSMGSSSEPSTMNMSLDEMIANRAKEGTRRSTRNRGTSNNVNKVSNVDKTIGSAKAKREAALRARRTGKGSGKASQMEIEKEVQKQHNKTVQDKAKKAKQSKKGTGAKSAEERAEIRKERREIARAAAKAKKEELEAKGGKNKKNTGNKVAETAPLGRPPSKKAVNAAVAAMEEKGFVVPDGYQVVVSFVPTASGTMNDSKPATKKTTRGRRGGGGGRGGGGRN